MNRRALFGFLGVSPVAVAGAALASQRSRDGAPIKKDAVGFEPPRPFTLSLHEGENKVEMATGRDGSLWLRPNGEGRWQRVVTE